MRQVAEEADSTRQYGSAAQPQPKSGPERSGVLVQRGEEALQQGGTLKKRLALHVSRIFRLSVGSSHHFHARFKKSQPVARVARKAILRTEEHWNSRREARDGFGLTLTFLRCGSSSLSRQGRQGGVV